HPDYYFPKTFGKQFELPRTLKSLEWLKDRLTIISHTDHAMKSGHGKEISFLSGVLPEQAAAFPEKNLSVDQLIARHMTGKTRFPSVNAALERGIRMSWNANGVEVEPITDPQKLFDHLFLNLTPAEKQMRRRLLDRNASILDSVREQLARVQSKASAADRQRLEQFAESIRSLESNLAERKRWIDRDKPAFDISGYFDGEVTIERRYEAIFDMIAYALETDLTRVATVAFPNELSYTDLGVTRSYHACTHNGKKPELVEQLITIESFQIAQLSRMLKRLDSIREPGSDGSLLDHTIVLFGSGMGYGGTHSNRNLPILVAGGGFRHRGHVDARDSGGDNMPLCNLFVTLLQRIGIERDRFGTSTGTFDLSWS
ncbi:MAG: DUF1552 domain-containing protein, partial [Planctomycetota bacterium]